MIVREPPGWRIDAKWFSGVLLVIVLAAVIPLLSFSQLTIRERAMPLLEGVLRLTLLPPGSDGTMAEVRTGLGFTPGDRLELLPGTEVYAESDELGGLSAEVAATRIADELSTRVLQDGAAATGERLAEAEFAARFGRVVSGPGTSLVRATLVTEMMPAGLDNGSRLANWRLQAQQSPGEPVQPIVGVFVRLPAGEIEPLSSREIGERVVTALADVLVEDGLPAARELVSNRNLLLRLEEAASGPIEVRLRELFETVLLFREEMLSERLELAREALQSLESSGSIESLPLLQGEELAGLSPDEANSLVLDRLARSAYRGGSAAVSDVLTEPSQRGRLLQAAPLIDALSARAHRDYLRNTWLLGTLAALLLVALALLSRGWGRLANPGLAIAVAAAGGALLFTKLAQLAPASGSAAVPGNLAAQGVFGYLVQLAAFVTASLPGDALSLVVRNHLAILIAGVSLVVLSLILALAQRLRPRRRSLI
ncbi:MAG: hypothetical protein WD314_11810 [Trueperaceae bacterium]